MIFEIFIENESLINYIVFILFDKVKIEEYKLIKILKTAEKSLSLLILQKINIDQKQLTDTLIKEDLIKVLK